VAVAAVLAAGGACVALAAVAHLDAASAAYLAEVGATDGAKRLVAS
jgi:hypothetical protein